LAHEATDGEPVPSCERLPLTGRPAMLDRVTVVVVTHHSAHCLDRLDPLLRHCPHVIIVDNASEDGTVTLAQKRWPHASILALSRNVGFGAANNMALEGVRIFV
jgi:GT2 family glycosyltransferase